MVFEGAKLYANPAKINKRKLNLLLKKFVDNGGELVEHEASNLILSVEPIESLHGKVVSPDWISDSIIQGKMLPLPEPPSAATPKKGTKRKATQQPSMRNDACMKSNPIEKDNGENDRYSAQGDRWRALTYRKAIHAIEAHHAPIRSGKEAKMIDGVGQSIAKKIDEIVATGHLKINEETPQEFQ
jgi:hypothetical protein